MATKISSRHEKSWKFKVVGIDVSTHGTNQWFVNGHELRTLLFIQCDDADVPVDFEIAALDLRGVFHAVLS